MAGDGILADGERYGFLIDDDEHLRPDPRSRRQPDGVHEASAAFDPPRSRGPTATGPGGSSQAG